MNPEEKKIYLYNTKTKKKEKFNRSKDELITLYTCGPTVYNYAHIGNLRAYMFEDLLKRTLKYFGYKVKHVMNITDVEDKIIKAVNETGEDLKEYTEKYTKAFLEDIDTLNIERADVYPRATEHIKEIVEVIKDLMDKGYAYRGEDGSIYYSVNKFKDYGQLFEVDKDKLKKGVRINQDEYTKEYFGDFALWKAWDEKDGKVYWETELGKGRPGWHIECTVMNFKHLGGVFENGEYHPEKFRTIDIHCGGVDNIFPHHENEIAQAEPVVNKPFVNVWSHCEHLLVDGKKMSKSLGNFYTLRDLLKMGYSPRVIRYVLITKHYRQKLNFTFDALKSAESSLERIDNFLKFLELKVDDKIKEFDKKFLDEMLEGFEDSIRDDLNISKAISYLFNIIKYYNQKDKISKQEKDYIIEILRKMDRILGFIFWKEDKSSKDNLEISEEEINKLIQERSRYRKEKNFKKADEIRDYLKSKGIVLVDTPEGTKWYRE